MLPNGATAAMLNRSCGFRGSRIAANWQVSKRSGGRYEKTKYTARRHGIAGIFIIHINTQAHGCEPVQNETSSDGSARKRIFSIGRPLLIVNKNGAQVLMQVENLTPGNTYTVWFVYFDNTDKCVTPNHCAPVDLTVPAGAPEGVFGRMDSAIAGPDGELTFQATLRDFKVSAGSAVHLALFSHGPANTSDLQERARQLLTPENPALGEPGLGLGTQKGFLVGAAMFDISSCR
jgi:hypothetical protein